MVPPVKDDGYPSGTTSRDHGTGKKRAMQEIMHGRENKKDIPLENHNRDNKKDHLFVIHGETSGLDLLINNLRNPDDFLVGIAHGHTEERVSIVGQRTVNSIVIARVLKKKNDNLTPGLRRTH